ncbi:hypothetical protein [Bdellovibrio bacteriovorus]|uniref:Uncharacterized protein n=1 Tax=Bdellovibrio bacteriovorus TaxID=959 RepID=A0A1Z3N9A9_BDEBC|nr:hypothetical protein [Bdellovibrio bacteriovorus]ASD64063.1 hypothetical protein B9G79_11045 [Bdellovibrio bacteriovorus]
MRVLSALFFVVLFSSVSFAGGDIEPYFEALKNSGANFEPDGTVCEEIARLEVTKEFGDAYEVTTGVEYSLGKDTIGELDVVVFERATHKVVLVAEVKCWKNLQQAMDKLKAQRDRFTWNLTKHAAHIQFQPDEGLSFRVEDFQGPFKFRAISQCGGLKKGFDQEIQLTLTEVQQLRSKLLKCQAWGECLRPQ